MASGIDGPGNLELSTAVTGQSNPDKQDASDSLETCLATPLPDSISASDIQEQGHMGSQHTETKESERPTESSHLSFANLMHHNTKPAAGRRDDVVFGYRGNVPPDTDVILDTRGALYPDTYNPSLHTDSSLAEEMGKVFDEDDDVAFQLKMDFSNPSAASEAHNISSNRFDEGDFTSHRRNVVHMSQPMATRLSSHDMKTIQSSNVVSTSKRRRQRSSSSSSSNSTSNSHRSEKSKKKKEKKEKKSKRKSLTAKIRDQTTGIPEEDEEESEEEEEEEERKDDVESEDGSDGGDDAREEDVDGHMEGMVVIVDERADGKPANKDASVLFTLGTEEASKAGVGSSPAKSGSLVPPLEQPGSFSSVRSASSSYSSSSVSEAEKKDKVKRLPDVKSGPKKQKKHHHHHHHRNKKHGMGLPRRRSGLELKEMEDQKLSKRLTSLVDDDCGDEINVEDVRSHRFEDAAGVRKHLLHRPVKKRKIRTQIHEKKIFDRQPHEVFVELDELISGEWKETARWIKFEEDVEESQKWGKPRVASLSFHSLLELRKTIERGAVMLDLENTENLTDVANSVVTEMVKTGQIRAEDQGTVLKVLLSKHNTAVSTRHTRRHITPEAAFPYNYSRQSFGSFFGSPSYASRLNQVQSTTEVEGTKPLLSGDDVEMGDMKGNPEIPSITITSAPSTKELKIMRKIPEGAEATAVLVGKVEYLEQPTMAFVRLAQGTNLGDVVALPIPLRFLFVLLGPSRPDFDYHEIGRSVSTLMADQEFRLMAYAADNRVDLLRAINEFLDDSIVLPPGQMENPDLLKNISNYQMKLERKKKRKKLEVDAGDPGAGGKITGEKEFALSAPEEDDPLQRTKKCFGGLIRDVKRRYPKYLSDITDAFNFQCLASIIFIYFAALSPAITFGGLLGEKTDNWMGVSEMILGCCIAGCTFGLFGGQPFLIIGSTGPLLVFEEAVYKFCISSGLPYLASRTWIGAWIAIISIVVVGFEGSFLVRFISRFTQEIFSVLISIIFIYETFLKLSRIYDANPLQGSYYTPEMVSALGNCSSNMTSNNTFGNLTDQGDVSVAHPNTALLSTLLMFGTFIIAYFLRQFKNSKFLRSSVRRTIGDFGVPIAIVAMVAIDLAVDDVYTQKLNVPEGISPTDVSKRGWLINPLGPPENPLPVWMMFAAILPAFLVFILIFMESHITEMIVSNKERNLKKGTGFHLNLLVLGVLNVGLSIVGMPWVCAAAIRSITHTNSLTIMSKTQAPGDKPKIEGVHEQRVTVFIVNACLGLSILMQPVLAEIPIAVLFGVFLYMGVTSLTGVQFVDRIEMMFMPSKHYPDFSYVKVVRPWRIHIFTFIEIICLAMLWVVKSTAAQIAFPFALVMTVPLRYFVLPKFFSKREMDELDSSESRTSVTSTDMDEYNDAQMPD
ncbi:band 3 anion transport protein-like isoform X2 [Clavelina lepadiformis]|uniref:band 3 anion transport protein-like isoform X2 n=1 Tax=Clavelina lepadiformis TaxID=159417 RepID=UPI004041F0BC